MLSHVSHHSSVRVCTSFRWIMKDNKLSAGDNTWSALCENKWNLLALMLFSDELFPMPSDPLIKSEQRLLNSPLAMRNYFACFLNENKHSPRLRRNNHLRLQLNFASFDIHGRLVHCFYNSIIRMLRTSDFMEIFVISRHKPEIIESLDFKITCWKLSFRKVFLAIDSRSQAFIIQVHVCELIKCPWQVN